jgi:hypothetical protein
MAAIPTQNEIVEVSINSTVYKIQKLGAKKGKEIMLMIVRVIGPAMDAPNKIAKFCELATDAQLDKLCDTFAAVTRISPEDKPEVELALKDVFDRHFSGKYGTMALWLKACLEANYGNFLLELGVDAGSLMDLLSVAMKADPSTPPEVSQTGQSGGASLRNSAD